MWISSLEYDLKQIYVKEDTLKTENLKSDIQKENTYYKSNYMNRTFIEKPIPVQEKSIGTRPIRDRKKAE